MNLPRLLVVSLVRRLTSPPFHADLPVLAALRVSQPTFIVAVKMVGFRLNCTSERSAASCRSSPSTIWATF